MALRRDRRDPLIHTHTHTELLIAQRCSRDTSEVGRSTSITADWKIRLEREEEETSSPHLEGGGRYEQMKVEEKSKTGRGGGEAKRKGE